MSVVPIPVAEGDGIGGGGGKGGLGGMLSLAEANSFQVASLDDRGTVSIWLASEVPKVDEGGSQVSLNCLEQQTQGNPAATKKKETAQATPGNMVMWRMSLGCCGGSHLTPDRSCWECFFCWPNSVES